MLLEELKIYSQEVIEGKIVACKKHVWSCKRFLKDLEKQGTDDFPYIFDEDMAERFLDWMRLFKHRKGILKGQNIEPHVIQKFVFGNIYGWINIDTGYRRFNKAYWQVGRKNAKSQSLSCVASYELMAFGEGASEVYCAATKTDQARIVWKETEAMLLGCRELKGKYRIAYGKIMHPKSGSEMKALSKEDRKSGDGLNPQCGIVDEYHAHETSEIYDIIDSGMVARPQPLLMIITTAGFELANPCYTVEYNLVSKILDTSVQYENDSYFVMINELDAEDNIKDESTWLKANPILCSYIEGIVSIRKRLSLALEAPEKMRDFLTKSMDIWVQQRDSGYMDMDKWKECGCNDKNKYPNLKGMECVAGVDLSKKIDLTSIGFEFKLDDGKIAVWSHSFIPEDMLSTKIKTDKMPYDLWIKQGWISTIPGAVVDTRYVTEYIHKVEKEYGWKVQEICYDPYGATQFSNEMQDEGYLMVEIRQGVRTLSEPTKNFRELIYQRKIIHNYNPVLSWAINNAVVFDDRQENIMLDKSKSRERIDPIAAMINAHVRMTIIEQTKKSIYEIRGMRSLL